MNGLANMLECPGCGDIWDCAETVCESCGARLLPTPANLAVGRSKRQRERFRVSSVTGYDISPSGTTSQLFPRTDFYVLDTGYCHKIVASFPSVPTSRSHFTRRRRQAEQLAASLNA